MSESVDEMRARIAALESSVSALAATAEARAQAQREWLALLAHELRSPAAAVLGYAELVQDGALGEIDPRAADAVRRIAAAADQLVVLLDGMDAAGDVGAAEDDRGPAAPLPAYELIRRAIDALSFDAATRNVRLATDSGDDVMLQASPDDALRAVTLALGAAIKVSPGAELRIAASRNSATAQVTIDGSHLVAGRDAPRPLRTSGSNRGDGADGIAEASADPREGLPPLTGGALRLTLAAASAHRAGGAVLLEAGVSGARVVVRLPSAPLPIRT